MSLEISEAINDYSGTLNFTRSISSESVGDNKVVHNRMAKDMICMREG